DQGGRTGPARRAGRAAGAPAVAGGGAPRRRRRCHRWLTRSRRGGDDDGARVAAPARRGALGSRAAPLVLAAFRAPGARRAPRPAAPRPQGGAGRPDRGCPRRRPGPGTGAPPARWPAAHRPGRAGDGDPAGATVRREECLAAWQEYRALPVDPRPAIGDGEETATV